MHTDCWWRRVLSFTLVVGPVAGCDFIEPVTANPNTVPEASLDQLLATVTVHAWYHDQTGSYLSNWWLQHVDFTDPRQGGNPYEYNENEWDRYTDVYTARALIDIRYGIALAEDANRLPYAGIFQVWEALLVGMVAAEYGDVAYAQAVNPDIPKPELDPQREVYEAVQTLLDEAIADLESGVGLPPAGADMVYDGDVDDWVAAAYTLKARYHLHWVEVDGTARYGSALTAARQGIRDVAGDLMAFHYDGADERRPWSQTQLDQVGAGEFLVEEMKARSDPRLPLYFGEGTGPYAGQIVGSPPGTDQPHDPGTDSSELACVRGETGPAECPLGRGYGSYDWNFPILSCAETYFIIAEAEFHVGSEGAARTALDAALRCDGERKGLDLSETRTAVAGLTGPALLDEIMMQKYFALFLNREVWNDYKRTCLPRLPTYHGLELPGRYLYPGWAREANPNIPPPNLQPDRNANDPHPCPSVG